MATAKQIKANRKNAKRSTGAKTLAGKAKVSRNRITHGLLSGLVVLPGESLEEYQDTRARILKALNPSGTVEELLVDQITEGFWRLKRFQKVETAVFIRAFYTLKAERFNSQARQLENDPADFSLNVVPFDDEAKHEQLTAEAAKMTEVSESDQGLMGETYISQAETFQKLARYETSIERGLFRALHELERLQRIRLGDDVPAPLQVDINTAE